MTQKKTKPQTIESLRRELKGSVLHRAFFVGEEAPTIDEEKRTVEVAFASEEPYQRWWGWEITDLGADGMDLSRLKSGAAVLVNHDPDQHVGVVEEVRVDDDRRGRARLRFGRSAKATEVFNDIVDGIRQSVSYGYEITDVEQLEERDGIPAFRVRTRPFEISTVAVPADATVGVGRAFDPERFLEIKPEIETSQEEETMTEEIKSSPAPDVKAVESKARDEAQASERKRVGAILAMGQRFEMGDLARQFVENGKPVDEFQAAVLERMGARPAQIDKAEIPEEEAREFSFTRFLRYAADPTNSKLAREAGLEREIVKRSEKGEGWHIPHDVLRAKRDLTVAGTTTGSKLVGTDHRGQDFIELLRSKMVMDSLGARMLTGLNGNIAIPRQSGGASAYYVAEGVAVTESNPTFDQVTMSPKTVGTFVDISRKLLLQSSPDVENLIRGDLAAVLARALDQSGIAGNPDVTATASQPRGIIYTSGIGSVAGGTNGAAPDWSDIVNLEKEVAVDNADMGSLAYLSNPKVTAKLKTTKMDTGSGRFVLDPASANLNGYRYEHTTQVPSTLTKGSSSGVASAIIFGNFNDAIYGLWSGLDVLTDPYTGGTAGTLRIIALQDFDFAVRHAQSFAAMLDALTA
jgi:HK97 family phage major capsid protein